VGAVLAVAFRWIFENACTNLAEFNERRQRHWVRIQKPVLTYDWVRIENLVVTYDKVRIQKTVLTYDWDRIQKPVVTYDWVRSQKTIKPRYVN
jgi:hypothetical protein